MTTKKREPRSPRARRFVASADGGARVLSVSSIAEFTVDWSSAPGGGSWCRYFTARNRRGEAVGTASVDDVEE